MAQSDVIVLGAGMVGTSTALALQQRGRNVLLLDRRPAGRETSYGNAGLIQIEAALPMEMPRALSELWRIARKQGNDINWHLNAMPEHASALLRYWLASSPARLREIGKTWSQLTWRAGDDHAPLIAAAGADHLIRKGGFRIGFSTEAAFDRSTREAQSFAAEYGRGLRLLDGDTLAAEEPALTRPFVGALQWTDTWACRNPGALVAAYAALFEARGGQFEMSEVKSITPTAHGWSVQVDGAQHEAPEIVIAAGPWSARLIAPLGYRVQILRKRGYHRHFQGGTPLNMMFSHAESRSVVVPMEQGNRVLTGAEIARENAPPTPVQLDRAEAAARTYMNLGSAVENMPWYGNRPCMPDMLPLAGKANRHNGLWLHFGHGHQGFTLGPTTSAVLADQMTTGVAAFPALSPARLGL
ncbi:NAD(P)/FAD-dependent oxidoreductase [Ketogulonicigenium vulgare]|uniref:NAD(P)/FAD-dependent oxidoreductase n=1 Tax=Ketogulonicigenium vulgare TaxID=92945 RepID=UPI0023598914|nr:FAD-dependent oxidoreductase [Ketogulonicigenium vulgare]